MEISHKACRCCHSSSFIRQNLWAVVDPFFARHGLHLLTDHQATVPLYDWGIRRKIDRLPAMLSVPLHRRLDHFRRKHLLTSHEIRIAYGYCTNCLFLAPWFRISDDQLRDYYAFYLKDEYKQARTQFQPNFVQLGKLMGSREEADRRRQQHEAFILPHLTRMREATPGEQLRVLDYGGGEGMLIPRTPWIQGHVLDVEAEQREALDEKGKFDMVQCLHVLEHVGDPWQTFQEIVAQCRQGGLIYIEVPIEFPGVDAISRGDLPPCHEHINKFCLTSIQALLQASPVDVLLVESGTVDFLHLEGETPVIRGLARKR
jgi:hypothetical protein